MARARRDSRHQVDIWPGFVDALSTLMLSIIFLLVVFVLAQFFLGQVLQGRNEAVQTLQGQVQDLTSQLGLEQDAADELRRTMARINATCSRPSSIATCSRPISARARRRARSWPSR